MVEDSLSAGAPLGHSSQTCSSTQRLAQKVESGDPNIILQPRGQAWASKWNPTPDDCHPAIFEATISDGYGREGLDPIAPSEMHEAGDFFKRHTSRGPDCLYVRHFGMISECALEAWSGRSQGIEETGCYPKLTSRLIAPLIPKVGGAGLRPIGTFSALHRVTVKLGRHHIVSWENSAVMPSMAAGVGKGPLSFI